MLSMIADIYPRTVEDALILFGKYHHGQKKTKDRAFLHLPIFKTIFTPNISMKKGNSKIKEEAVQVAVLFNFRYQWSKFISNRILSTKILSTNYLA